MGEVFDSALQETGQRILQLAVIDVLGRDEEGLTQHIAALGAHEEFFTYIVRDSLGRILLASHRADLTNFQVFPKTGFHQTADFRYYPEAAVQGTITLTISEPLAHRQSVGRELAMGLSLPLLAVIPLSILGIAYGLGIGLRPLGQLRKQLARRDAIEGTLKRLRRLSEKLMQLARAEGAQLAAAKPHDVRIVLSLVVDEFSRGADASRIEVLLPQFHHR